MNNKSQTRRVFTRTLSAICILFFIPSLLSAKQLSIPEMNGPVNDHANVLKVNEKQEIENFSQP